MTRIFLQVCAGLANRLRATVSGIRAAEELGCSITISWPKEAVFGATWADLFESDLAPWIRFIEEPIQGARMCLTTEDFTKLTSDGKLKKDGDIVIKSYGCFQPMDKKWLTWLRRLRPLPKFVGAFSPRAVGVHIRRTDNATSCLSSPTPAFHAAMNAFPPTTHFFLATDDPVERKALMDSYPGRIIVYPTTCYHRDLKEGIEQGFREFLALAACSEILGSVGSSFSEMAAAYGGLPLRRVF
jgi:hypothetical protein